MYIYRLGRQPNDIQLVRGTTTKEESANIGTTPPRCCKVTRLDPASMLPAVHQVGKGHPGNIEVEFGGHSRPIAFNSVVLLPDLITVEECHLLRDACDRRCSEMRMNAINSILNPELPLDVSPSPEIQ